MKIIPTGIVVSGICQLQTNKCVATEVAPITAVWTHLGRRQVNVCRSCLVEKIRMGDWYVEGAKVKGMRKKIDVAVFDSHKRLLSVVEVKNRLRVSENWAAQLRYDMVSNAIVPDSRYFVLALPDIFFLWKNAESEKSMTNPSGKADASKILPSYLEKLSLSLDDISVKDSLEFREEPYEVLQKHHIFQQVITFWLKDVVQSDFSEMNDFHKSFVDSGFYDDIKGGEVVVDALVD